MAISPGTRLGPYEILSAIGAGGMGEVYRAKDTRLDRIVAIKVLPAHLADRPELRERFEREAKTIASLNHPHICTLFDTGHQDGIDYLVMEYIEGETLAQRLTKGPLPLEQVLQYAIEIADALDKAHRKGITHRDLKPGNIMLAKSGTKLLDFGLAKLKQEAVPATPESQFPTMKSAITQDGTILGTLQYMAPEQLEAKEVDARTDIFAFGVVVYEMATGKKAFEGKSQASLMVAILEREPPAMSSLRPMTPPALDHIVKQCLAKDPEERWQSASDLRRELKWIAEGGAQLAESLTKTADRSRWLLRWTLISGLVCLLVAAIAGLTVWNLKPASPRPVTHTVITLPPGDQLAAVDSPAIAISPDGTQLAYVALRAGTRQIYLRALDNLEAKPLSGTEGAGTPFFSPDGQWLGFYAADATRLKKVSIAGGSAVTLAAPPIVRGASWGNQRTIAFATINPSVLELVPDAGGTPQALTHLEKGETDQGWPQFLPGSKAVLFAAGRGGDWASAQVAVQSIGTGVRRNLINGASMPSYASSGHLVYAQGGNLMAVPFDLQRLGVTGAAVPVIEGVLQSTSSGAAQYSFSATGSLVYVSGAVQTMQSRLVWVSRKGVEQPLATPAHGYKLPRLSPDERRLAVTIDEQESQLWLYDLSRDTLTRLTFEGDDNFGPLWTPDSKRIAFRSNKEGPLNIFWQLADGSGGLERLTTSKSSNSPESWSPDGQLLSFTDTTPTGNDIWVLNMRDRKAQPFIHTSGRTGGSSFSPDGHWLAFVSEESGRDEIYVQPYPGPGGRYEISTEGGTEPAWNRTGTELFYRSGDKMMAVDVSTQPSFSVGKPRMLFRGPYMPSVSASANYDVSADGQRFVMIKPIEQEQAAPTQINIVQNWFEELKQKVPTGKK